MNALIRPARTLVLFASLGLGFVSGCSLDSQGLDDVTEDGPEADGTGGAGGSLSTLRPRPNHMPPGRPLTTTSTGSVEETSSTGSGEEPSSTGSGEEASSTGSGEETSSTGSGESTGSGCHGGGGDDPERGGDDPEEHEGCHGGGHHHHHGGGCGDDGRGD